MQASSVSINSDVRRQLREETEGQTLDAGERFALEQKYGLEDAVLTFRELEEIKQEAQ